MEKKLKFIINFTYFLDWIEKLESKIAIAMIASKRFTLIVLDEVSV